MSADLLATPKPDFEYNVPVDVSRSGDTVFLQVGVVVLGMTPNQARALAAALVRKAT